MPTAKPPALLTHILSALEDAKAQNPVSIPLEGKTTFADYLVVATGTSTRHISSMVTNLTKALSAHKHPIYHAEGTDGTEWVCLDAGDVVIHLFTPAARTLYNLEKLWASTFPTASR